MIHLYALARAGGDPRVAGIAAAPVVIFEAAGLHAIVSHHDEDVRATPEAALAHVTVIEALAAHTDVLPVRFGPGHADTATLQAELDRMGPQLHTLLDRVAGHVEFVLRATEPPAPASVGAGLGPADHATPGAGQGRAYLEARGALIRAEAEREEALRDRLRTTTEPLASAAVAVRDTTGRHGPERCFLVPRRAVPAFAAQARQLTEDAGDLVVGGPWPPFTFSSLPPAPQVDP